MQDQKQLNSFLSKSSMRLDIGLWYIFREKKKKPKYNLYISQYHNLEIKRYNGLLYYKHIKFSQSQLHELGYDQRS